MSSSRHLCLAATYWHLNNFSLYCITNCVFSAHYWHRHSLLFINTNVTQSDSGTIRAFLIVYQQALFNPSATANHTTQLNSTTTLHSVLQIMNTHTHTHTHIHTHKRPPVTSNWFYVTSCRYAVTHRAEFNSSRFHGVNASNRCANQLVYISSQTRQLISAAETLYIIHINIQLSNIHHHLHLTSSLRATG